jgi:hypothetical protein
MLSPRRLLVALLTPSLALAVAACSGGGSSDASDGDVTATDATDIVVDADANRPDVFDAPMEAFTRDVTVEASVSCSTFTDCASCTGAPDCGWCGANGQCVPGDSIGATGGACTSGWVYYAEACMLDAGVGDASPLTWSSENVPTTGSIHAIWGAGTDVYAAAAGGIFHSTGDGHWTMQYMIDDAASVWGSSPHDVYAVVTRPAGAQILHSTGDGTWTAQFATDGRADVSGISAIWGSVANDVWAAAYESLPVHGVVLHSSGDGNWVIAQTLGTGVQLVSIYGSGPNDIYVAGQLDSVFHFDGTTWSPQMMFTDNPGAVWLADSSDVYVGGALGVWFSIGDGMWSQQLDSTLNFEPAAIGGSSRNDVYAVGVIRSTPLGGTVLHSNDGANWTSVTLPPHDGYSAVWARSSTEVFIGAGGGVILHSH